MFISIENKHDHLHIHQVDNLLNNWPEGLC